MYYPLIHLAVCCRAICAGKRVQLNNGSNHAQRIAANRSMVTTSSGTPRGIQKFGNENIFYRCVALFLALGNFVLQPFQREKLLKEMVTLPQFQGLDPDSIWQRYSTTNLTGLYMFYITGQAWKIIMPQRFHLFYFGVRNEFNMPPVADFMESMEAYKEKCVKYANVRLRDRDHLDSNIVQRFDQEFKRAQQKEAKASTKKGSTKKV